MRGQILVGNGEDFGFASGTTIETIDGLSAAIVGRAARRRRTGILLRLHAMGMSVSYIVLITAFYVDNGPHLPLWRHVPRWAFWIIPSVVGGTILIRVMTHHPLLARSRRSVV